MIFDSRRSTVHARRGMVATSQPLAAMAGVRVLLEGGNAVDGAVAAAAALSVVEPFYTGVGGDLFALVWMDGEKRVRALNGSGRAPGAASLDALKDRGLTEMPYLSPYSVTVPGTVDGWDTLLRTCGSMPLGQVLEPAIEYAEEASLSPRSSHGFGAGACLTWPGTPRASSLRETGGLQGVARWSGCRS